MAPGTRPLRSTAVSESYPPHPLGVGDPRLVLLELVGEPVELRGSDSRDDGVEIRGEMPDENRAL